MIVACLLMLGGAGAASGASRAVWQRGPAAAVSRQSGQPRTRIRVSVLAPRLDAWVTASPTVVKAIVSDRGSRVTAVGCNGHRARVRGRKISCRVRLRRGVNVIRITAHDRAGNTRTVTRRVHFGRGLLAGRASARALPATHDSYDRTAAVPPALTGLDGPRVARTMVEVAFAPAVTVGRLDSLLSAIGGRIVGSLTGVAIVDVQIPDPRTLAGLHKVIARLERARGVVRYVNEAVMTAGDTLPANISPSTGSDLQKVAGSLAIDAPAAWNAASAIDLANRPTIVIGDNFGDGVPDGALDAQGLTASMFGTAKDPHGYAVAGVIAGSFGGDASARGTVTGVFPTTTRMSVVDATLVPESLFEDGLIQAVKAAPGNVVVNTSRNDCSLVGAAQSCPTGAALRDLALGWIEKVRGTGRVGVAGAGLERKFLQATSAGNIRTGGPTDSQSNSAYDAAHELTGLVEPTGTPVPPLSNVLTVEGDFAEDPVSSPPGIDCLDATSKRPGDISAVGDVQNIGGLWSLTGATAGAGFEAGTSFATPQVAAVAEYVWTLEPRLSAQQLAQLLKATAQRPLALLSADPGCDQLIAPVPAIDAYGALLSLDTTQLPLPGTDQPVRTALLDSTPVTGKHEFREDDLADFLFAYFDASGSPVAPTARDYSRWDLNGDGFTGGTGTAPFDLDRTGSSLWGKAKLTTTLTEKILGRDVTFDETAVSDLQILCYYAYSPLYLGDQQFRDTRLGPKCLGPPIAFQGPGNSSATSSIYTIAPDGSGETRLTNNAFSDRDPAWSPDRKQIAYVSDASGFDDLRVMNADGSNQHPIRDGSTGVTGSAESPSWSPDGQEIAYLCGCGEWRAMRPDGTGDRLIWDPDPGAVGGPDRIGSAAGGRSSWSPDGSRLVVSISPSGVGAPVEIWTVGRGGSNPTRLTTGATDQNPRFSPDGTKIVFDKLVGGTEEIRSMNTDGTDQTQLTTGHLDLTPQFSPDSAKIVFVRVVNTTRQLFTMNADGSDQTQVPTSRNAFVPAWSH